MQATRKHRAIDSVESLRKAARAVSAVVNRVDDPESPQSKTVYEIVAMQAVKMCLGAGVTEREASLILGLNEREVARLLDPATEVPREWARTSFSRTLIVAALAKAWAAA